MDSPNAPKHVGITLCSADDYAYAESKGIDLKELYEKRLRIVLGILELQVSLSIPIVTVYLLPSGLSSAEGFDANADSIEELFLAVKDSTYVHGNQVKVSVLGKWYDLPGRVVDAIKGMIEATKDYDRFFFNICVNYDGQDEIVDACRIVASKVKSDRLDADSITKEVIKDSIYASYFIPPELIIINGDKRLDGFLLWDSAGSRVHFTGRQWHEFRKRDFLKAMKA